MSAEESGLGRLLTGGASENGVLANALGDTTSLGDWPSQEGQE